MDEIVELKPLKINTKQMDRKIKMAEFSLEDLKHSQANKVQGGRTVFARWQHIPDPSGVDTIRILACPEEVPLVPTSLLWLLNWDPSVTHSKLSNSLSNMRIKPMTQWFYIHNSPNFYFENVLTCELHSLLLMLIWLCKKITLCLNTIIMQYIFYDNQQSSSIYTFMA